MIKLSYFLTSQSMSILFFLWRSLLEYGLGTELWNIFHFLSPFGNIEVPEADYDAKK